MSAREIRHRYRLVLALLNEGENEDRWVLGELIRLTIQREQDAAAAKLAVSDRAFRLHLVSRATELGLELTEAAA